MKYIKIFESFNVDNIHQICVDWGIKNYTINEDGSIDVNGNVYLGNKGLYKLPLKFRNVSGGFNCCYNMLTSLVDAPDYVGGDFDCESNNLTSLIGAPKTIIGGMWCGGNQIKSFEGAPESVGKFSCVNNPIETIWFLFKHWNYVELFNDYDCVRGNDLIIDRLKTFLEDIGSDPTWIDEVIKHYSSAGIDGYNIII